jgi:lipocalin-like protein
MVGVPPVWPRRGEVLQQHGLGVTRQLDAERPNFRIARHLPVGATLLSRAKPKQHNRERNHMSRERRWLLDQTRSTVFFLFVGVVLLITSKFGAAQSAVAEEPAASRSSVPAELIGSWRLVSRQSRKANGEIVPDPGLSGTPLGILIYDKSGHVAAQLSRRDRTLATLPEECQAAVTTKGTPDTAQTILGYDAYFGTYTVNEHDGTVIHHLEAALFPGDIGKDIERHFKVAGDQLTTTFNTTTREGVKVTRTLLWERMK